MTQQNVIARASQLSCDEKRDLLTCIALSENCFSVLETETILFTLCGFDGIEEVAKLMGVKKEKASEAYSRAKKKMRGCMSKWL